MGTEQQDALYLKAAGEFGPALERLAREIKEKARRPSAPSCFSKRRPASPLYAKRIQGGGCRSNAKSRR